MIVNNGFKIAINRIAKDVPDYTPISKVKFGTEQNTITITDVDLNKPVPISKWAVVDACDATTGWSGTEAQSLVSVNTTTYKEGTGALNIYKTSATSNTNLGIKKSTLTSRNATNKFLSFWIYIKDETTLAKFISFTVRYGSSTANYYHTNLSLSVGWSNIFLAVPSQIPNVTGSPNIAACTYFEIFGRLENGTSLVAAGDFIIDDIYLVETTNLIKDLDAGYPIIDEDNAIMTYRATLGVAEGNGFLINSLGSYNSDTPQFMQDIFLFPEISKSSGDEIVIEFRNRLIRRT